MKIFCFFIPFVLLFSCEGYDFKLRVKNSLPHDVYVVYYDTTTLSDYPNASLDSDLVKSDSIKSIPIFGTWTGFVNTSRNKKLNLFVIHADTVDKYPTDTIIQRQLYSKQVSYTLQELEQMAWVVEIK